METPQSGECRRSDCCHYDKFFGFELAYGFELNGKLEQRVAGRDSPLWGGLFGVGIIYLTASRKMRLIYLGKNSRKILVYLPYEISRMLRLAVR